MRTDPGDPPASVVPGPPDRALNVAAAVANARFGLGGRPDQSIQGDPREWLRRQLDGPDTTPVAGNPTTAQGLTLFSEAIGRPPTSTRSTAGPDNEAPPADRLTADTQDLLVAAVQTATPFRERLVWFWANHFTIGAGNLLTTACAGAYVREAIRPHVTGRFADMLLAVMRHPAMVAYLDQTWSAGPDSLAGRQRHAGLNENLARECLELHTVGPASGYTQEDVTSFARLLTGWSIEAKQPPLGFRFRAAQHQPGEQIVMGRVWPKGEGGGVGLLSWLAQHPATHRHLAEKLVRHFVADDPPAGDIRAIAGVLRDTGGDLGAAAAALVALPNAWVPLTKLRTPQEYVVATLRAGAVPAAVFPRIGTLIGRLGQPMFRPPSPMGWSDRAADWAGPAALLQRVDFAEVAAAHISGLDTSTIVECTVGPLLSATTQDQIGRCISQRDATALFFASPEMQRR